MVFRGFRLSVLSALFVVKRDYGGHPASLEPMHGLVRGGSRTCFTGTISDSMTNGPPSTPGRQPSKTENRIRPREAPDGFDPAKPLVARPSSSEDESRGN